MIRVRIKKTCQTRDLPIGRSANEERVVLAREEDDGLVLRHAHHLLEWKQGYAAVAPGYAAFLLEDAARIIAAGAFPGGRAAAPLQKFRRCHIDGREELHEAAIGKQAHPALAVDVFQLRQILQEGPELHI